MTLKNLQPYNSNFEIYKSSVKFDVGRTTKKISKPFFLTKDIPILLTTLRGLRSLIFWFWRLCEDWFIGSFFSNNQDSISISANQVEGVGGPPPWPASAKFELGCPVLKKSLSKAFRFQHLECYAHVGTTRASVTIRYTLACNPGYGSAEKI